VGTVLRITFDVSDRRTYNDLRRSWENDLPKDPNAIGRIYVQPSLGGTDDSGQMSASPDEPEFIEYLKSKDFSFKQEAMQVNFKILRLRTDT
jgi:hypothetical protein